jgi:hypothetical protein
MVGEGFQGGLKKLNKAILFTLLDHLTSVLVSFDMDAIV